MSGNRESVKVVLKVRVPCFVCRRGRACACRWCFAGLEPCSPRPPRTLCSSQPSPPLPIAVMEQALARSHSFLHLLLLLLLLSVWTGVDSFGFDWVVKERDRNPVFSPCGDTTVQKYDGFTFGLAFSSNQSFYYRGVQLSPCDHRLSLSSGRLATFRPEVDQISLLTINASSLNLTGFGGYMVAFAGSKFAAKSFPHAVTEQQHVITSFTLIMDFSKGRLQTFLWKSDGCSSCKGKSTFVCLKGQDCAIPLSDCKTFGGKVDCSLSIQLAFSGTDNRDEVLNSWYQIDKLHQYSLYGLYSNLKNSLTSQYNKFF